MDRPFPARSWTLYYGAITNALVIFPLFYLIVQVHTYLLLPRFEVKLQDTNSLSRCTCVYGYITLIKHWLNLFLVNILDTYSIFQIDLYFTQGGPVTWLVALVTLGFAWIALQQLVNVSKIKEKKSDWTWDLENVLKIYLFGAGIKANVIHRSSLTLPCMYATHSRVLLKLGCEVS